MAATDLTVHVRIERLDSRLFVWADKTFVGTLDLKNYDLTDEEVAQIIAHLDAPKPPQPQPSGEE